MEQILTAIILFIYFLFGIALAYNLLKEKLKDSFVEDKHLFIAECFLFFAVVISGGMLIVISVPFLLALLGVLDAGQERIERKNSCDDDNLLTSFDTSF
ncbi:MAG: hypothetical protein ABIC36_03815 [bacterium]